MGLKSATVLLVDGHTLTWSKDKDALAGAFVTDGGILIVSVTVPGKTGPALEPAAVYNVSAWITVEYTYE